MKQLYANYVNSFKGLVPEIWILSFVTFVNRAGAMVIPFLSIYLVSDKGFTLPQVGMIMTCYGVGSLLGNYIGGILTDKIGFYKTIVLSLFFGGIGFILLQFIGSYIGMCIGVFVLMFAVDVYRPGVFVAADVYGDDKDTTRNIGLIRLAINLGFSIGPVLGGLLIAKVSYNSIFWVDGITCVIASFILLFGLKPKKANKKKEKPIVIKEGVRPLKNNLFLLLFLIMLINSIAFVQYFSTIPLFYKSEYGLTEDIIGWIMFLNGAMIVILEMPLISWLERLKLSKTMATFWGIILLAFSIIILNMSHWFGILIIGMILMTLGEMIGSPFASALALDMAPKGRKGTYMGLFSMSFSFSHIIGHNASMNIIDKYGFETTWNVMFIILIIASFLTIYLFKRLKVSKDYNTY
ncbi:MFS transporter [Winogradskyella echinorum]|uniref:MFS transporter n=1 Tax=Winogradskyella echinorum TaxID=538189 RepID=A0ABR6XWM0_9FLAO|nr:MFS transporter [Winogradskyella echinorum]MBC3844888.1 MFS transporter [Winogradskyella echinorum]MBC5749236.1 MFS transporter [Winogradskyella echinorum]